MKTAVSRISGRFAAVRPRWLLVGFMLLALGLPLALTLAATTLPPALARSFASPALVGAGRPQGPPALTAVGWWRRAYQDAFADWFANRLEPRGWTVRITNQIYFTLFRRSRMRNETIVIGRDDMLFPVLYLHAYCRSAIAADIVRPWVEKLAELRDRLARRGSLLLLVLTPSKAVTLPEFLPAGICRTPAAPDAPRRDFLAMAREAGLPVFDGAGPVHAMRRDDPVLPFPPGGGHWSRLVAARISAGVMAELGRLSGEDLGGLRLGEPEWEVAPENDDRELARVLNLLSPGYADATASADIGCAVADAGRSRAIVGIGMSFLEQILQRFSDCGLFASAESYFYYDRSRRHFPGTERKPVDRAGLDWNAVFARPAVLLVEFNEARLDQELDWLDAFLDDALGQVR
jgi:hypothetical protein